MNILKKALSKGTADIIKFSSNLFMRVLYFQHKYLYYVTTRFTMQGVILFSKLNINDSDTSNNSYLIQKFKNKLLFELNKITSVEESLNIHAYIKTII